MTSVLSLALLAAAAVLAGRWATRRRDALGRPVGFPVWSVAVLVVLAVAVQVPAARRRAEERRLSRVASQLVGHQVTVRCQTTASALVDVHGELGFVKYDAAGVPEPRTLIKRDPCKELRKYTGGDRSNARDVIIAVHVLTHEAMHMRGETNEARAECQAVQRDERTAELLGASPAEARALARTYWRTVYPDMPDDYRTGACAPGGDLDEQLETAPWS